MLLRLGVYCLPLLTEKGTIALIWIGLGPREEDVLAKVTQSLQGHGVVKTAHTDVKCGGTGVTRVGPSLLQTISAISTC